MRSCPQEWRLQQEPPDDRTRSLGIAGCRDLDRRAKASHDKQLIVPKSLQPLFRTFVADSRVSLSPLSYTSFSLLALAILSSVAERCDEYMAMSSSQSAVIRSLVETRRSVSDHRVRVFDTRA